MHVALTGASGFIGSKIAQQLHAGGHTLTALVRKTSQREHIESHVARFVIGDQDDSSCWDDLLEHADCIIHNTVDWLAYKPEIDLDRHLQSNIAASLRLLERSSPIQFIFMSTIAVHHDIRPRWHGKIDEDHPTRPASLYGAYKASVEAHLWSAHFQHGRNVCAIRPCGVYGIDPQIERSIGYSIVQQLRETGSYSRHGGGKFVHVEDVASAIVACVGNQQTSGSVFNLADCYARWCDWADMIAVQLGIDANIDRSSAAEPKNQFTKDAARSLGVRLDRGHAGIRTYVKELILAMD